MGAVKKVKNWFKNYWYYYKWPVIIVSFFIVIIIFCTVESGDREDYDACILYTGPHKFEIGEKDSLSSSFVQVMSGDYDKNGKKNIQIVDLTAFTDEQIKEAIGTSDDPVLAMQYAPFSIDNVEKNFTQQVSFGDTDILILDRNWYDRLLKADRLVKLEEVLGYSPESLIDEYSSDFSKLDFAKFFDSASKLPEGTVICFRKKPQISGNKASEKHYNNSKKMLIDIFEFKIPD